MKINPVKAISSIEQTRAISRISSGRAVKAERVSDNLKATDDVKISSQAGAIGELITRSADHSAIRQARVEQLRALVAEDNYHPAADEIADAIIATEGERAKR